jgi:hypothetical protein
MPNQELQNRFFQELQASKSFQLLTPEEQAEVKNAFINATDEQLQRGLEEIGASNQEMQNLETRLQQLHEENVKLAEDIKKELAKAEKIILAKNVAKDKAESSKAAEALLTKIEELSSKEEPQEKPEKRKKFLGIF